MVRIARFSLKYVLLTILLFPFGVFCHEVIGHGLVAVLCGAKVENVEVLGFRIWPKVEWVGRPRQFGTCRTTDFPNEYGPDLMALAGSMSTWLVSVVAGILLWTRRWGRWSQAILITLSLWWIDLFTYTLPSWGIPRFVFWGRTWGSEPYEAAVGLGIPGRAFHAFVLISSILLLSALLINQIRNSRRGRHSAKPVAPPSTDSRPA